MLDRVRKLFKGFVQGISKKVKTLKEEIKVCLVAYLYYPKAIDMLKQVQLYGGKEAQVDSYIMYDRLKYCYISNTSSRQCLLDVYEMCTHRKIDPKVPEDVMCLALSSLLEQYCEKFNIRCILEE